MNNTFPVPAKDATLLRLTEESVLDNIKKILGQFWLPPHELKAHVEAMIAPFVGDDSPCVVVSGETKNISLYVLSSTGVLAMTPLSDLNSNMLLREMYGEAFLPRDTVWYIFPPDASLLHRLSLPRVLLINPCVLENFPIPRLCLSIGLLASYLRKYQKADVHIIGMQVGPSVENILREAVQLQPALIGMSVSYGQKHLALSILKEVYESKKRGNLTSQVVLGNIIPASFPEEFIGMYPDIIVACGEGEVTILRLVEYLTGTRELADVPGVAYTDASGQIRRTLHISVPVETIPLPALDIIKDLSRWHGALTLELSRGCQWNVCTFCPREHKSGHWKTFATPQILEQFGYLRKVCNHFGLTRHIFLADEEFVGGMNDGMETERITDLAQALFVEQKVELDANFLSCRVVSVMCETQVGKIRILGLYVPSRGAKEKRNVDKRRFQQQIMDVLQSDLRAKRESSLVVAGDLNVVERNHVPHYPVFGEWEYEFYESFIKYGLVDAYRLLHPDTQEYSWFGRKGGGYRFDHFFISEELMQYIINCSYVHSARNMGLSDHSGMVLVISPTI